MLYTTSEVLELQERAWQLQAGGRLDEALDVACRALQAVERTDGPESVDAANLLNDLAEIETERRNFSAALDLAQRARTIERTREHRFKTEVRSRICLKTLELLGNLHQTLGDYPQAEGEFIEALTLARRVFGNASCETATARNNLGALYNHLGRFSESLSLLCRALYPMISIHGEHSPGARSVYHNLAALLYARGDYRAAEEPARKAWRIAARLLGEEHPQTLIEESVYGAILVGLRRHLDFDS
jgi:tetratricopeptide (TPR) repeat protein